MPSEEEAAAEPVVVFVTTDVHEAALVKSMLAGSGIDAALYDEHFSRMDSPLSFAVGGVKVVVPRYQERLTREVLVEYRCRAGHDPRHGHSTPFRLPGPKDPFDDNE